MISEQAGSASSRHLDAPATVAVATARLADGFPQRAERLLQRLETGDIAITTRHESIERSVENVSRALSTLVVVSAIGLLLLSASLYVLAAEIADPARSNRVDTMQILVGIGASALVVSVVHMWRQRKR